MIQESDLSLKSSTSQSKANVWTEIGEAQITHNLFGRARVRIVRKHDALRRALWLSALVTVTLAIAVQGWQIMQAEPIPEAEAVIPQDSEPIPAVIEPPALPPVVVPVATRPLPAVRNTPPAPVSVAPKPQPAPAVAPVAVVPLAAPLAREAAAQVAGDQETASE